MADDGSEITGNQPDNQQEQPAPQGVPANVLIDLTTALNAMREEMVTFRAAQAGNNNPNPPAPPAPPVRNIRNSTLNYYPNIDKLCTTLYLDGPPTMESKSAIEWLKSLYTLASILRCSWILDSPPTKPTDVTDGEVHQVTLAIMANFSRKIPPELKVSLPVDVDDDATTPSQAYLQLMEHFAKPDPYMHDKFRAQLESRSIGKSEKIAKFMKWHRELRAQMVDAQFPEIKSEATTIKWIIRSLSNHPQYSQLASSWCASGPPSSLSELESILASEEAEMDRSRRMDNQLQALMRQLNRKPNQSNYNQDQNNHQPAAQANPAPPQQHNNRGRGGRGRGGRGRGRGQYQNPPKIEANANMAQQLAEVTAQLHALREQRNNADNDNRQQHAEAPQANDQQRQVHFQDQQPPYGINDNEMDGQDDDNEDFEEGMYLLDSAASPSHVSHPMSTTNPLPKPIIVNTPNGKLSLNSSTKLTLPIPSGVLRTDALVNPNMPHHLISPIPISQQHGPVVLTDSAATVLPPNNPITRKAIANATPIASVRNGVYMLTTPSSIKSTPTPCSAMGVYKPKPRKVLSPVKPTRAVIIPSHSAKKRKTQHIGVSSSKNTAPLLKLQAPNEQRRLAFDFHLLFNHATPKVIMETLKNPKLQYDPAKIPSSTHAPMNCGPCHNAKMRMAPHHRKEHSYVPGEAFSSDVAGPLNFKGTRLEEAYFVTCVVSASRYAMCIPIVDRTKVVPFIESSITQFMSIFNKPPRIFVSDNAKEYISADMAELLNSFNIQHYPTTPYTAQENGIAERLNQTFMNAVRAALYTADLPPHYWQFALLDVVDKYNQLYHSSLGCSPFMKFYNASASDITGMQIFGQLGHCPNRKPKSKLEPKSQVVRYLHRIQPSHLLVEMENGSTQRIRQSDFKTYDPFLDPKVVTAAQFHNSDASRFPPDEYKANAMAALNPIPDVACAHAAATAKYGDIPTSINQNTPPPRTKAHARLYPDADQWMAAIDVELDKLDARGSVDWSAPNPNKSHRPIPFTVNFEYKRDNTGKVIERKAKFALRGDLMIPDIHYDPKKCSAPMADKATVRLLISIAADRKWPIEHMDMKSAYIHTLFKYIQSVYVREPPRADGTYKHGKTFGKLMRNVYGGKLGAYYFLEEVFSLLHKNGFTVSAGDQCLLHKTHRDGSHTLVALSSDDHIVTASNQENVDAYYALLSQTYETKRLGKPTKYLGWHFSYAKNGSIGISQPLLVEKLIDAMEMTQDKPSPTPYVSNENLHPPVPDEPPAPISPTQFAEMVGYLRYLADSTRPDICYVTSRLAAANRNPTLRHYNFLKKVTRYLKGTSNLGLLFTPATGDQRTRLRIYAPSTHDDANRSPDKLSISSDADFANDITDRTSISGTVITLNHTPIAWFSRKQKAVAMSTAESEYRAIAAALQLEIQIQRTLLSLPMILKLITEGLTDNKSALDMLFSLGGTKLSKFIDLRHQYIQHEIKTRKIGYRHVPSANMKADILTKALTTHKFTTNRNALFLFDCSALGNEGACATIQ